MRRSSGGDGCTTSLLPAAARAPQHPRLRLRHPVAEAFPPASGNPTPLPSNNKATPRLAQSPGRGDHVPAGEGRNGSPARPAPSGGSAVATAGGSGGRLQPMRATVPFQLEAAAATWQPHAGNGGGGGSNNNGGCCGGASGPSGGGGGGGAPRTHNGTGPTRGGGSAAAHQPHGGHADGRVRDVHARHQPTRAAAPGWPAEAPRPQPPPLLGTVSSSCSVAHPTCGLER